MLTMIYSSRKGIDYASVRSIERSLVKRLLGRNGDTRVVNVSKSMDVYKGQVLEEEEERGEEGARSNDIRVSALFPAWHEENDPLGVRERKLAPLRIVRRETPEDGGSTIKC